jgi:hypothetical protein
MEEQDQRKREEKSQKTGENLTTNDGENNLAFKRELHF